MLVGAFRNSVDYIHKGFQKAKNLVTNLFQKKKIDPVELHSPGKARDKCGVFGIFSREDFKIGTSLSLGMNSIQNRGQDACGCIYFNSKTGFSKPEYKVRDPDTKKGGLVNDLFYRDPQEHWQGQFAIGHTLYATSKTADDQIKPHPIVVGSGKDQIALVHNGNIPDTTKLKNFLLTEAKYSQKQIDKLNDSGLMAHTIQHFYAKDQTHDLDKAIREAKKYFIGAYSIIVAAQDEMAVLRDPVGIRPLSLGRDKDGRLLVASETHAFDVLGGEMLREIQPGELLVVNNANVNNNFEAIEPTIIFEKTLNKLDMLEPIYIGKPQSKNYGKYNSQIRRECGKLLKEVFTKENPGVDLDFVVAVPQSGIPAATGFAEAMGLPINPALVKNSHRRTFLDAQDASSDDKKARAKVRAKFALIKDALRGKNIALVDDSIVRGTTSKELVKYIREEAQPASIHLLAASPPLSYPDFYGIDMPNQKKLIAYRHKNRRKAIAKEIGADSVTYLDIGRFVKALGVDRNGSELSKTDGLYSIYLGESKMDRLDFHSAAAKKHAKTLAQNHNEYGIVA